MKPQQQKPTLMRAIKSTLLLAIVTAIVTMSFAPEVAKPLFVKYYRAIYAVETVKTL